MRGVSRPHPKRQARVSAENKNICNSPLRTMRGVKTFRNKLYGKYELSANNNSRESIKYSEFFPKFEKPSETGKGLGRNPFLKKLDAKNLVRLSL
jgi:hypothetical protein